MGNLIVKVLNGNIFFRRLVKFLLFKNSFDKIGICFIYLEWKLYVWLLILKYVDIRKER